MVTFNSCCFTVVAYLDVIMDIIEPPLDPHNTVIYSDFESPSGIVGVAKTQFVLKHKEQLQALQSNFDKNSLDFATARTVDNLARCCKVFELSELSASTTITEIDENAEWSKIRCAESPERSDDLLSLLGTQVGLHVTRTLSIQDLDSELNAWMRLIGEAGHEDSVS